MAPPIFALAPSPPSSSPPPPPHHLLRATVGTLAESAAERRGGGGGNPVHHPPPIESLRRGDWVKLICGASFEDAADVRNLSLVYTLAGVDCIDCAADESVVNAVNEGINVALSIARVWRPWVMISVNDDREDLHFRKAGAVTYVRDPSLTSHLLSRDDVDAIEIHTSGRGTDLFSDLWSSLGDSLDHVKLIAVSLPDVGPSTVAVMNAIYSIMESRPCRYNLWQLDGRPMSGDIGRGATREAIAFAVRLASTRDKPHGFYQVAGGTNSHTIDCLKKVGLFQAVNFSERSSETSGAAKSDGSQQALIGGIAYGGYARKIVGRVLRKIPTKHGHARIEDHREFLLEALKEAFSLLRPVKCYGDFPTREPFLSDVL